MNDELLDLGDIAALYRCSRRHARDVIVKQVRFPEIAPGSTPRNPLWLRVEVRAYLHRGRDFTPDYQETYSTQASTQ